MKHRHALQWLMVAAFCLVMTSQASAQGFEFDVSASEEAAQTEDPISMPDAPEVLSFKADFRKNVVPGEWIWLDGGWDQFEHAVSVCVDRQAVNTLYLGGNEGLYVSHDAGESWKEVFRLTGSASHRSMEDVTAGLTDEQIIQYKREFIYNELSTTYDSSFADVMNDEITDDELLRAEKVDDIDILSEYELDIEDDLTHAFDAVQQDDVSDNSDILHQRRFIDRYAALIAQGAYADEAIETLQGQNAVWEVQSGMGATWALTSESLKVSRDRGVQWQNVVETSLDHPYVSLAVSSFGEEVAVGTTDGLYVSRDGGRDWVFVSTDKIVLKMAWLPDKRLVLTTSEGAFVLDAQNVLHPLDLDLRTDEVVLDIAVSDRNEALFLTENTLFYMIPDGHVSMVSVLPFDTELMRQVIIDKTLDHVFVRTDMSVYELREGEWRRQTEGLFGDITRFVTVTPNRKNSSALLVTDSGVMVAVSSVQVLGEKGAANYERLKRQWSQEPSDADILHAALCAHGLDASSMSQWKTRIWTSLLLPKVNFSYYHKNTATDRATVKDTVDVSKYVGRTFDWDQQRSRVHYWEVMAHWDFSLDTRNRDEINVQRLMYRQSSDRQKLITLVSKVIRNRHKKQMASLKKNSGKREVARLLDIAEYEAQLYYLTGGYFRPKYD